MAISSETHETSVKAAWVDPVICELDIDETRQVNHRGADGDKHADCTRS